MLVAGSFTTVCDNLDRKNHANKLCKILQKKSKKSVWQWFLSSLMEKIEYTSLFCCRCFSTYEFRRAIATHGTNSVELTHIPSLRVHYNSRIGKNCRQICSSQESTGLLLACWLTIWSAASWPWPLIWKERLPWQWSTLVFFALQ